MAFGDGFNCKNEKCKNELFTENKEEKRQSKTENCPRIYLSKGVKMSVCLYDIPIAHRKRPKHKKARWPQTNNEINVVNHSFQICLHYDELWRNRVCGRALENVNQPFASCRKP